MRRTGKLLVATLVMAAGLALGTGSASAGNWAMTSLDAAPSPVAGRAADVGFTIRQHGVTPVNLDAGVGIEVRDESGSKRFFVGQPVGAVGHYVARVRIDEPGPSRWRIRQGWFGEQDLGRVDVADSVAGGASDARGAGFGFHRRHVVPDPSAPADDRAGARCVRGGGRDPDAPAGAAFRGSGHDVSRAGVLAALAAMVLLVATPLAWSQEGGGTGRVAGARRDGRVLFRLKGCSQCHVGPDTEPRMSGFPDLSHAPDWAGLRRPGLDAAEYVAQSIRDPSAFRSPAWTPSGGQPGMPALTVTEPEVRALVSYLLAR